MIKVVSNIIPFEGFVAITLWPFVIIRKDMRGQYTWKAENHENIHGEQQKEMLIIGVLLAFMLFMVGFSWWSLLAIPVYFWLYLCEWLVKTIAYCNALKAYRNISFELEAYDNQEKITYIDIRRPFAWIKYF